MQVWCDWQVTLCDPHLSALEVRFSRRGTIQSTFTFTFTFIRGHRQTDRQTDIHTYIHTDRRQTCRQMPVLTRHPKLVLTTRGERPSAENNFEKDMVSCIRGRSSAITQRIRTLDKLTPRARRVGIDVPRPRVHSSITPYEQNVSRTAAQHKLLRYNTHT